jgi:hypothetical protein
MSKGPFLLCASIMLLLVAAGCGAPATIQRFETFATTGATYTHAVEGLIDDTSELLIDADSAKLLETQKVAEVTPGDYKKRDDTLRQQVRDLRLLKRQAQVLGQYFEALGSFVAKDESEQIAGKLSDLGSTLSDVANALDKGNALVRDGELVGEIVSGVGTAVVKGAHAGRLRQELEERGEVIARVLRQQADILKGLAQQAEAANSYLDRRSYRSEVVQPFLSEASVPEDQWDDWMDKRRDALVQAPVPDSLHEAVDAAVSLRAAWVALLSNELDEEELQEISSEVTTLAAAGQESRPAPGK